MSFFVKWKQLQQAQKEGLFLLRNAKKQFEAIAMSVGFSKDEINDLQCLMKELVDFAPFVMKECYEDDDEKKIESKKTKQFTYQKDFDVNGIVYWIGIQRGQKTNNWINPNDSKDVIITSSSLSCGALSAMIGRKWTNVYTKNVENSWIIYDFKGFQIKPNKYTICHGSKCKERSFSWDVNTNKFYTKFKIVQFGKSGQNNYNLSVSGFEIYGMVKY